MDKHKQLAIRFRPSLTTQWEDVRSVLQRGSVIVNANLVAQSRDALGARLMQHPGFRIDPITYRLGMNNGWYTSEDGVKPPYLILEETFGDGIPFKLLGTEHNWRRRSSTSTQRYVTNVLSFQRDFLLRESRDSLRLFSASDLKEVERGLRPAGLLLPYQVLASAEDISDQVAIWSVSPGRYEGISVEAVVALHTETLDKVDLLTAILEAVQHASLRDLWLWVPGFRPHATSIGERRIRNLKALVQRLSEGRAVRMLHGGFLEMVLAFDGVEEVTCDAQVGVAGIHSKPGGFVVAQYYATAVHSLISFDEARFVSSRCVTRADLARELCPCALCGRAWERLGATGFVSMFLTGVKKGSVEQPVPESAVANRLHALVARMSEGDLVRTSSVTALLADASIPRLLNRQQTQLSWTMRTVS